MFEKGTGKNTCGAGKTVGQKVGLSEMLKNYAGSVSELIKN